MLPYLNILFFNICILNNENISCPFYYFYIVYKFGIYVTMSRESFCRLANVAKCAVLFKYGIDNK